MGLLPTPVAGLQQPRTTSTCPFASTVSGAIYSYPSEWLLFILPVVVQVPRPSARAGRVRKTPSRRATSPLTRSRTNIVRVCDGLRVNFIGFIQMFLILLDCNEARRVC